MAGATFGRLAPWGLITSGAVNPIRLYQSAPMPATAMALFVPSVTRATRHVNGSPGIEGGTDLAAVFGFENGNYCGARSISGVVRAGATPLQNILVLLTAQPQSGAYDDSAEPIDRTFTAKDGSFSFTNLAYGTYSVQAIDLTGTYDGGIYTFVLAR